MEATATTRIAESTPAPAQPESDSNCQEMPSLELLEIPALLCTEQGEIVAVNSMLSEMLGSLVPDMLDPHDWPLERAVGQADPIDCRRGLSIDQSSTSVDVTCRLQRVPTLPHGLELVLVAFYEIVEWRC